MYRYVAYVFFLKIILIFISYRACFYFNKKCFNHFLFRQITLNLVNILYFASSYSLTSKSRHRRLLLL